MSRTQPRPARSRLFDAGVAAIAALLGLSVLVGFTSELDMGRTVVLAALVATNAASLYWRRSAPWPAFIVNVASVLAIAAAGLPAVVVTLSPIVAVYTIASLVPLSPALGAMAIALVSTVTVHLFDDDQHVSTLVGNLLVLTAAWLFGSFVRQRQEYVERLEERTRELEQAREELATRAVAEERLRLARELHDVVAHSLSMIAVQSGAGAHVIDERPDEARRALTAIQDASRQALDEMRRVVGVLRDDDAPELAPIPGVADLEALVEQVSEAGPRVDLHSAGEPRPLPPGIDVTVYRIVQESLTNVVRHAGAGIVRVGLAYGLQDLRVEILDDGRAPRSNGRGHGLQGMRERVELLGGTFEAGPMRDGGFRVAARIPLEEDRP
jgi:signal transduction histidine kinase